MSQSHLIEFGGEPAGVVARSADGYRFVWSRQPFEALQGAIFNSPDQARVAARLHRERQLGLRADNRPAPRRRRF